MEPIGIILLVVALAVAARLIAGSMDGDRIEEYVRKRGGKLRKKEWAPFGTGWFGEKSDRIYEVEYESRDGEIRRATVKTSLFTGVYLTGDRIVRRREDAAPTETDQLRAENARLTAEIERLKRLES